MEADKIAIIIVDISAGFIVFLIGLGMLSFPYDIIWAVFNIYLWIVLPMLILWSWNKKDTENVLN
jgi:hypothetical protein